MVVSNLSGSLGGPRTGSSYFFSVASAHACMEMVWYICTQEVVGERSQIAKWVLERDCGHAHTHLAKAVEHPFEEQGNGDDDGANGGDDPCGSVLQCYLRHAAAGCLSSSSGHDDSGQLLYRTVPFPSVRLFLFERDVKMVWVAANKVASSSSIYNGPLYYSLTWIAVLDPSNN